MYFLFLNNIASWEKWIIFAILASIVILFIFILYYVIRNYIQNIKRRKEILNAIYQTEDRERNRIAKDLHDNIGAILSTIKLLAGSIKHLDSLSEIKTIANNISDMSESSITELRTIIKNIIPSQIQQNGWVKEIELLKIKIERTRTIQIYITSTLNKRFRYDVEMNLFRIIQELINNVIKHAQANKINLSIIENKDLLFIRFEDDGIGFEIDNIQDGIGLKSLEARVNLYQGHIVLTSQHRLGTSYDISLPIKNLI